MSLTALEEKTSQRIALLGLPFDHNSSYARGAAAAPPLVRAALECEAANSYSESGVDARDRELVLDLGDLEATADASHAAIVRALDRVLAAGLIPISIGGDHAVTWPVVQGIARHVEPFTLLQVDAHPDLYDDFGGNPASHASPFARILEEGLVRRLVQVGVRTLNPHQREQVRRFGVEVVEMRRRERLAELRFEEPVYVSLDLDGLDPAFAPGVSHPEPGGLSTREVIDLLQRIDAPLIGADVVELNPARDPAGSTAVVAAKLVKELVGLAARS